MGQKITQRDIPNLPEGTYSIGDGLCLRKGRDKGRFFLRIQVGGKRRDVTVGSTKHFTLSAAKVHAEKLRSQIRSGEYQWGGDALEKSEPTFREFYGDALAAIASTRQLGDSTLQGHSRRVVRYAVPVIGGMKLSSVTRDDILKVLEPIWYEKTASADSLRAVLENIFSIAIAKGLVDSNPAAWRDNLSIFLPPPGKVSRVEHHPALSFTESALVLSEAIKCGDVSSYRALTIVIMTARRIGEVLRMKWQDVDFDSMIWTVPDENMKIKRGFDRRVPIPRQLGELMKQWAAESDSAFGEYVCASKHSWARQGHARTPKPCQTCGVYRTLKRSMDHVGIERDASIHGFRSTFTDWCAEHAEPVELVELSLDHESGNAVRQAYFRSDLLERRRELLQRYADALFDEIEKAEGGGVASSDTTP